MNKVEISTFKVTLDSASQSLELFLKNKNSDNFADVEGMFHQKHFSSLLETCATQHLYLFNVYLCCCH